MDFRKLLSLSSADTVVLATALTFDPSIVEIFIALSSGACLLVIPKAVRAIPDLFIDVTCVRNKATVLQVKF